MLCIENFALRCRLPIPAPTPSNTKSTYVKRVCNVERPGVHPPLPKISAWRLKRKVHIKLVDNDNVLGGTGTDEVSAIRLLR
jgi:hypothetical protein